MREITTTIKNKVAEWNNICASICPSLFLADSFEPKPIPGGTNAEVIFWYDITNLYALLADCMPYLLKEGKFFNRTKLRLNDANSLLTLLQNNSFLNSNDIQLINNFVKGIKEARSCFCHNKYLSTFNAKLMTDGIGIHPTAWRFYTHLGCTSAFNFDEASDLLFAKTTLVIAAIDKALTAVKRGCTDIFVDDWSKSIAAWYMSSNDIIFRGLLVYRNSKKIPYIQYGFDKMEKDAIEALAASKRVKPDKLVQDLHSELTDAIIYGSAIATPENILFRLFDSVI